MFRVLVVLTWLVLAAQGAYELQMRQTGVGVVLLAVSFYYTLFTSNWVAAVYGLALCGIATLAVHLCMRAWDLPRD